MFFLDELQGGELHPWNGEKNLHKLPQRGEFVNVCSIWMQAQHETAGILLDGQVAWDDSGGHQSFGG